MFETMRDIKNANHRAGFNWFDAGTMRFFNSRVGTKVYGGRYFVSSEQNGDNPRRYTVRKALPSGRIETVGDFGAYKTLGEATKEARRLAAAA